MPARRPAEASRSARAAGQVFDGIAALYDRARPGSPAGTVADLLALCQVARTSRILEIGCGTGQLTRHLAPSGARIVCLEPGPQLATIARQNLAEWENVEVVTATFEDFEAPASSVDVVVSATAFHWIDPNVSFSKAARVLDEDGRLALVTNAHSRGGTHAEPRMTNSMRALHRRVAPELGEWQFPTTEEIVHGATHGGDILAVWTSVERKMPDAPAVAHLFGPPTVKTYPWTVAYRKDDFLAMLASQSQYALMEPGRRDRLFDGIGALVDENLGGTVTKDYVAVLAVAANSRQAAR